MSKTTAALHVQPFLVHFFDVHCTTTTGNFLMQLIMEDVNTRGRILDLLFLFEPEYSPLRNESRKNRPLLTI